jgi:hypothetical protein
VIDSAFSSNFGRGAAIQSHGSVSLVGSEFTENEGLRTSVPWGHIVELAGPATVEDSTFSNNLGSALFAQQVIGGCALVVSGSSFEGMTSDRGAAINSFGCPVSVSGSRFEDNYAESGFGGAISYVNGTGELVVERSTFDGNRAEMSGGAVHVHSGAARFLGVTFVDNVAGREGGALYGYAADVFVLRSNRFVGNDAGLFGGAVGLLQGPLDVSDSEFSENTASYGAAVHRSFTEGAITLTNATMTLNRSMTGAAVDSHGSVVIRNSILWANTPSDVVLGTGSVTPAPTDVLVLSASNLSGTYPALVAQDPRFVDPASDFRLRADSPGIDRADDAVASSADLSGNSRYDVPGVPICQPQSTVCGSIADMGAYEWRVPSLSPSF